MQYFFTGSIIAFNFFSPGYINSLFLRREKKKLPVTRKGYSLVETNLQSHMMESGNRQSHKVTAYLHVISMEFLSP